MAENWKLGLTGAQIDIPRPASFSIGSLEIARTGRVASGKLVKDVIAKKKVFTLGYKVITPAQLDALITNYNLNSFLDFTYPYKGVDQTVAVWFADFPRERLLTKLEYWGEFKIVLQEQ